MTVRFAVIGDPHGNFRLVAEYLNRIQDATGPLDVAFAVGDVQANRTAREAKGIVAPGHHWTVGDFPDLVAGEFNLPTKLAFIAGNHDPFPSLDKHPADEEWAPGVTYLGRAGMRMCQGINVAFLSGIYSPRVFGQTATERRGQKDKTYFIESEAALVLAESEGNKVDLLLTHDWPSGLTAQYPGTNAGQEVIRQLSDRIAPQVHACGHMHVPHQERIGPTDFVCLTIIQGGDKAVAVFEKGHDGRITQVALPDGLLPPATRSQAQSQAATSEAGLCQ